MGNMKNIGVLLLAILTTLAALFGLLYNLFPLFIESRDHFSSLEKMARQQGDVHFLLAYFSMSGICILCYLLLLVLGIDLLRGRLRWTRILSCVLLFEVIYFYSLIWIFDWALGPTIGKTIGAAFGVANGGLEAQFSIGFPLWAPIVLWWAKRQSQKDTPAQFQRTAIAALARNQWHTKKLP